MMATCRGNVHRRHTSIICGVWIRSSSQKQNHAAKIPRIRCCKERCASSDSMKIHGRFWMGFKEMSEGYMVSLLGR